MDINMNKGLSMASLQTLTSASNNPNVTILQDLSGGLQIPSAADEAAKLEITKPKIKGVSFNKEQNQTQITNLQSVGDYLKEVNDSFATMRERNQEINKADVAKQLQAIKEQATAHANDDVKNMIDTISGKIEYNLANGGTIEEAIKATSTYIKNETSKTTNSIHSLSKETEEGIMAKTVQKIRDMNMASEAASMTQAQITQKSAELIDMQAAKMQSGMIMDLI